MFGALDRTTGTTFGLLLAAAAALILAGTALPTAGRRPSGRAVAGILAGAFGVAAPFIAVVLYDGLIEEEEKEVLASLIAAAALTAIATALLAVGRR